MNAKTYSSHTYHQGHLKMISHKHTFIFISPPKTGSTSILSILLSFSDFENIIEQPEYNSFDFCEHTKDFQPDLCKKMFPKNQQPLRKHAFLESYYKKHLQQYKILACIRNPYDRAVSLWKWEKLCKKQYNGVSFKQWLNMRMDWWHRPQLDFLQTDIINMSSINLVRFENLQQDFDSVCDKIGIPRQQLPHKNKSKHKHYTEYYDDETREIVAKKYAKDIEYFGYKFGE